MSAIIKLMYKPQRGFTILELIIIIGILGVLFMVVLAATHAQQPVSGNNQRRADVNSLLTAIETYAQNNNGNLPPDITTQPKTIASAQSPDTINLCTALVPTLLSTIPIDPMVGSRSPDKSKCTDANARYNSGYTVQKIDDRHIRVSAPGAEGGETIFANN